MPLSPEKIYKKYRNNSIDKKTAADSLISLIENTDKEEIREYCIDLLEEISPTSETLFSLLENLLISDSDINVRAAAFYTLKKNFPSKLLEPLKHLVEHDDSFLLIPVANSLAEIDKETCRQAIINRIKKERFSTSNPFYSIKEIISVDNPNDLTIDDLLGVLEEYMYFICVDTLHFRKVRIPFYSEEKDRD